MVLRQVQKIPRLCLVLHFPDFYSADKMARFEMANQCLFFVLFFVIWFLFLQHGMEHFRRANSFPKCFNLLRETEFLLQFLRSSWFKFFVVSSKSKTYSSFPKSITVMSIHKFWEIWNNGGLQFKFHRLDSQVGQRNFLSNIFWNWPLRG